MPSGSPLLPVKVLAKRVIPALKVIQVWRSTSLTSKFVKRGCDAWHGQEINLSCPLERIPVGSQWQAGRGWILSIG